MTTIIYATASLATEGWCELDVDPKKFEKSVKSTYNPGQSPHNKTFDVLYPLHNYFTLNEKTN